MAHRPDEAVGRETVGRWREGVEEKRYVALSLPAVRDVGVEADDDEGSPVVVEDAANVGNGWEREGDVPHFFYNFSPQAYGLGINILIWAMTH